MSLAYLQAISAQAGLNIRRWEWDDGIDIEIGSDKPIDGVRLPNIAIPLQVKATARWEIRDGKIAFPLKSSNYERLRRDNLMVRQYLVLYTLPQERDKWVVYEEDHCELYNCAFYFDFAGEPELPTDADGSRQETKTIRVPVANRLTGPVLFALFEKACDSVRAWRTPNV